MIQPSTKHGIPLDQTLRWLKRNPAGNANSVGYESKFGLPQDLDGFF